MIEKRYANPDIYSICVPLPNNPLQNLNCYVIQSQGETLILDTGFNQKSCMEALMQGLEELSVDWEKASLFLTHLHSDHVGLVADLMKGKKSKIYMSEVDHRYLHWSMLGDYWEKADRWFEKEGFPEEYTKVLHTKNPARSHAPSGMFDVTAVKDGDKINVGNFLLTCIFVPGHTPGQMCLYLEEKEILFTADHVLFDITPNIASWLEVSDSLGKYIQSLYRVQKLKVKTAFPAHRTTGSQTMYQRIEALLLHHENRLWDTIHILETNPNSSAYETASHMKWSMRGKNWEEFPISQRWFAVGETVAHLDYLIERNMVVRIEGKVNTYSLCHHLDETQLLLKKCIIQTN